MTGEELRDYVEILRSQNEISYDVYSGLIDEIDTLEQEPKAGYWIDCGSIFRCSECGNWVEKVYGAKNFCDECGAKMFFATPFWTKMQG